MAPRTFAMQASHCMYAVLDPKIVGESEICVSARAGLRRTARAWYATEGAPPGGWRIAHQIDVSAQEKFRESEYHKPRHNANRAGPARTLSDASIP